MTVVLPATGAADSPTATPEGRDTGRGASDAPGGTWDDDGEDDVCDCGAERKGGLCWWCDRAWIWSDPSTISSKPV